MLTSSSITHKTDFSSHAWIRFDPALDETDTSLFIDTHRPIGLDCSEWTRVHLRWNALDQRLYVHEDSKESSVCIWDVAASQIDAVRKRNRKIKDDLEERNEGGLLASLKQKFFYSKAQGNIIAVRYQPQRLLRRFSDSSLLSYAPANGIIETHHDNFSIYTRPNAQHHHENAILMDNLLLATESAEETKRWNGILGAAVNDCWLSLMAKCLEGTKVPVQTYNSPRKRTIHTQHRIAAVIENIGSPGNNSTNEAAVIPNEPEPNQAVAKRNKRHRTTAVIMDSEQRKISTIAPIPRTPIDSRYESRAITPSGDHLASIFHSMLVQLRESNTPVSAAQSPQPFKTRISTSSHGKWTTERRHSIASTQSSSNHPLVRKLKRDSLHHTTKRRSTIGHQTMRSTVNPVSPLSFAATSLTYSGSCENNTTTTTSPNSREVIKSLAQPISPFQCETEINSPGTDGHHIKSLATLPDTASIKALSRLTQEGDRLVRLLDLSRSIAHSRSMWIQFLQKWWSKLAEESLPPSSHKDPHSTRRSRVFSIINEYERDEFSGDLQLMLEQSLGLKRIAEFSLESFESTSQPADEIKADIKRLTSIIQQIQKQQLVGANVELISIADLLTLLNDMGSKVEELRSITHWNESINI